MIHSGLSWSVWSGPFCRLGACLLLHHLSGVSPDTRAWSVRMGPAQLPCPSPRVPNKIRDRAEPMRSPGLPGPPWTRERGQGERERSPAPIDPVPRLCQHSKTSWKRRCSELPRLAEKPRITFTGWRAFKKPKRGHLHVFVFAASLGFSAGNVAKEISLNRGRPCPGGARIWGQILLGAGCRWLGALPASQRRSWRRPPGGHEQHLPSSRCFADVPGPGRILRQLWGLCPAPGGWKRRQQPQQLGEAGGGRPTAG